LTVLFVVSSSNLRVAAREFFAGIPSGHLASDASSMKQMFQRSDPEVRPHQHGHPRGEVCRAASAIRVVFMMSGTEHDFFGR